MTRAAWCVAVALVLTGCGGNRPPRAESSSPVPTTPRRVGTTLPVILSFVGAATCPAGTAQLSWRTVNGTEVWLRQGSVSGDVRGAAGAVGPLPAAGSLSRPYDCDQAHVLFQLAVYGVRGQDARVLQVDRPG